jgi:hypothetical protein
MNLCKFARERHRARRYVYTAPLPRLDDSSTVATFTRAFFYFFYRYCYFLLLF